MQKKNLRSFFWSFSDHTKDKNYYELILRLEELRCVLTKSKQGNKRLIVRGRRRKETTEKEWGNKAVAAAAQFFNWILNSDT